MPHVCAVVVAAGLSSRMHTFKPLLPIKNKPAIVHLSDVLLSAGVFPRHRGRLPRRGAVYRTHDGDAFGVVPVQNRVYHG